MKRKRSETGSKSKKKSKSLSILKISPFWNTTNQQISEKLWIPQGNNINNHNSIHLFPCDTWFQSRSHSVPETQQPQNVTSSLAWPSTTSGKQHPMIDLTDNKVKTRKMYSEQNIRIVKYKLQIHNKHDRKKLNIYFDTVRWSYNQAIAILRDDKLRNEYKASFNTKTNKPYTLRGYLYHKVVKNDCKMMQEPRNNWLKRIGVDVRASGTYDAYEAFKTSMASFKNGTIKKFKLGFRSRKKTRSESFNVAKKLIKIDKENHIIQIRWPTESKTPIKKQKRMRFHVPELRHNAVDILHDCRIQRTRLNEYYLCVPVDYPEPTTTTNSDKLRVCSLDPGVRTFQTIYDVSKQQVIHVGMNDNKKLEKIGGVIDKLRSKGDKGNSKKHYRLGRKIKRLNKRIRNLVDDLHKQLAKYLVTNYDVIIIPIFETSQMAKRVKRKINSKTTRSMLTWRHYSFRERLIFKARQFGSKVAIVGEQHTSKTCSCCGSITDIKASKVYMCSQCGIIMDRDANAAKNIFLKNHKTLEISLHTPIPVEPTPWVVIADSVFDNQ